MALLTSKRPPVTVRPASDGMGSTLLSSSVFRLAVLSAHLDSTSTAAPEGGRGGGGEGGVGWQCAPGGWVGVGGLARAVASEQRAPHGAGPPVPPRAARPVFPRGADGAESGPPGIVGRETA